MADEKRLIVKNCENCINSGRPSYEWPCTACTTAYGSAPSKWESTFSTGDFVEVGQRWIPVTERFPDLIPCDAGTAYSEAVIVCTSGRKIMVAVWDGIDFLCDMDYWEAWGEQITHWVPIDWLLPLPELPKEDS